MEKNNKKQKIFFYAVSLGSLIGFSIAIPLVLFLLFGLYLDRKFQTLPLFLILGSILGIAVAFYETKKLILPFLEKRLTINNKKIIKKQRYEKDRK